MVRDIFRQADKQWYGRIVIPQSSYLYAIAEVTGAETIKINWFCRSKSSRLETDQIITCKFYNWLVSVCIYNAQVVIILHEDYANKGRFGARRYISHQIERCPCTQSSAKCWCQEWKIFIVCPVFTCRCSSNLFSGSDQWLFTCPTSHSASIRKERPGLSSLLMPFTYVLRIIQILI